MKHYQSSLQSKQFLIFFKMAFDFSDSHLITSIQFWYSRILLTRAPFWFCNLLFYSIRSSFYLSSCLILSLKPIFIDFNSHLYDKFCSWRSYSFLLKYSFCMSSFFICVFSVLSFFQSQKYSSYFCLNLSYNCMSSFLHYNLDFLKFFSSYGRVYCNASICAQSWALYLSYQVGNSRMMIGQGVKMRLRSFHPMGLKIAFRKIVLTVERLIISPYSRNGHILIMRITFGILIRREC